MAFAVQVLNATDIVIGAWSGPGSVPTPPGGANYYYKTVTDIEYADVQSKRFTYGGGDTDSRWEIVGGPGGTLTELTDNRIRIKFTDTGTTDEVALILIIEQGGQGNDLAVDVLTYQTDEVTQDLTFNGDLFLIVSNGHIVKVGITSGVGSIMIDASFVKSLSITEQGLYKLLNFLRFTVVSSNSL